MMLTELNIFRVVNCQGYGKNQSIQVRILSSARILKSNKMRNKLAKRLRRIAEEASVGQSAKYTKRLHRALKKEELLKRKTNYAQ